MSDFFNFVKEIKIPSKKEIEHTIASFSKKELVVFVTILSILILSAVAILQIINSNYQVETPSKGGSFSEGIVGTPRFVNPVLASSDADKDITALIYSGLMRKKSDGTIVPDLAEKYTISPNGLVYSFVLKNNIYFHDKKPITTKDIDFTIKKINNPIIKSPEKSFWDGVETKVIDEKNIQFMLSKPYAPFLENTTLGILPSHLWGEGSDDEFSFSDLNIHAIGSGPYKITKVANKSSGIVDYYILQSFSKYIGGQPFINKISFYFYPNEKEALKALSGGKIDQLSAINPTEAHNFNKNIIRTASLPRIFGLFFNSNQSPLFADKKVIEAFNQAINKDRIIETILSGYGTKIDSPIPPKNITHTINDKNNKERAISILEKDGWVKNASGFMEKKGISAQAGKKGNIKLQFSLSTAEIPELSKTAELIKEDLESIGAKVDLKIFEIGNLNQDIISPRKYEALLFGQVITSESDLFAFWHSSQKNDPGLNIALYSNKNVDTLLETATITLNPVDRDNKYAKFEQQIKNDIPAIFIYSQQFIYAVSKKINGISLNSITNSSERFLNITEWYIETDSVWKFFIKNKNY